MADECEAPSWAERGKAHRAARIGRGEYLIDCARRLGVSSVELSAMECGRANPAKLEALPMSDPVPDTTRGQLLADLDGAKFKVWSGVAETYLAEARSAQAVGQSGGVELRIAECTIALADLYKDIANAE